MRRWQFGAHNGGYSGCSEVVASGKGWGVDEKMVVQCSQQIFFNFNV
jgi:hypothetical protein